jgi:hypothetical protein
MKVSCRIHFSIFLNLQPCPHIYIAAGDRCCAEEDMSTEATCTVHSDRILATVGCCTIKSDLAALITAGCIYGPCCLIPSTFEVIRNLSKREGHESKGENGSFREHDRGKYIQVKRMKRAKRANSRYLCC